MEQPVMMTLKLLEVENFLSHTWGTSYTCMICGDSFKHKGILVAHHKSHKEETEAEGYEKEGSAVRAGDLHDQEAIRAGGEANREGHSKHSSQSDPETREKPHACTECRKSFKMNVDLTKHLCIHTGERPFPCTDCSKRLITKSQLREHQRIHTGEKPYKCLDCGKNFTQKSQLIVHRQIHRGEKPYQCSSCQKSFVDKSQLVVLHWIHTGDRPFKCDWPFKCATGGKDFKRKEILITHQQVHTGEAPFQCPQCSKSFSQKANLMKHQLTHTLQGPFICSDCGQSYTTIGHFKRHQRNHLKRQSPPGEGEESPEDVATSYVPAEPISSHSSPIIVVKTEADADDYEVLQVP